MKDNLHLKNKFPIETFKLRFFDCKLFARTLWMTVHVVNNKPRSKVRIHVQICDFCWEISMFCDPSTVSKHRKTSSHRRSWIIIQMQQVHLYVLPLSQLLSSYDLNLTSPNMYKDLSGEKFTWPCQQIKGNIFKAIAFVICHAHMQGFKTYYGRIIYITFFAGIMLSLLKFLSKITCIILIALSTRICITVYRTCVWICFNSFIWPAC